MATLQDIADEVGISKAAVSRILNHKGSFSAATVTRVEEAARRLNYATPAMLAEERQGTRLILAVVPPVTSPYFGALVTHAEHAAAGYGYGLVLQTSVFDRESIERSLHDLERRRVAGILLGTYADYVDLTVDSSLPIVTVGYKLAAGVASVRADGIAAGQIAARHLLGKGCRHLAYLTGYLRGAEADERYRGFASVLSQAGIEPLVFEVGWSSRAHGADAEVVTRMALEHPEIDGIFAEAQSYTACCLRVYAELGYRIPEDVRVVGYGTHAFASWCSPVPTIVCEDTERVAGKAVEFLVDAIENGVSDQRVPEVVVPVMLEVNQTT